MTTSFASLNLHADINKALAACGYTETTEVQANAISPILNGQDAVVSAPTGTGKTAAFLLPTLHKLLETKAGPHPRVLILTPTRELATQIMDAIDKYAKFLRINTVSLVGGMPYRQQLRGLSRPVDIIVATPGRLLDHMTNHRLNLSAVGTLILDEADRMLDMGFIDDVKDIAKATPASRQTLLFSATIDKKLSAIIKQLLKEPVRIEAASKVMSPVKIKQELYIADNQQHKARLLKHFINDSNVYKAIIFSATKMNADRLTNQFRAEGIAVAALHGDLKQAVRNRTIEEMRRGKIQFLIATDVAARGIDIPDLTHVINYDLPKFHEDYVHRIGRTGRAGQSGIAISFVLPEDTRHLRDIERFMNQQLEFHTIEGLEPTKKLGTNAKPAARGRRPGGGRPVSDGARGSNSRPSYSRDDRPSYKKSSSGGREGRGRPFGNDRPTDGGFKKERPSYKKEGSYAREERPFRKDSAPRGDDHGNRSADARGDRPFRSDAAPRGDRPFRSDSAPRGDRPFRSDAPRGGRSDRQGAPRGDRPFRSDAAPRGDRPFRSDAAPRSRTINRSDERESAPRYTAKVSYKPKKEGGDRRFEGRRDK